MEIKKEETFVLRLSGQEIGVLYKLLEIDETELHGFFDYEFEVMDELCNRMTEEGINHT
ncbi:MAG: hypothetical protein GY853_16190 [PVC group bacterium]|nr:hypothetical protein [PVC group bacterium]